MDIKAYTDFGVKLQKFMDEQGFTIESINAHFDNFGKHYTICIKKPGGKT